MKTADSHTDNRRLANAFSHAQARGASPPLPDSEKQVEIAASTFLDRKIIQETRLRG
jgi:hypothetical protein